MNRSTLLLCLALTIGANSLSAATPAAPAAAAAPSTADVLAKYDATFQAELKKYDDKREADLATLRQQYLASLKKLESTEQAAGNLDPLLGIREEITRFEKEQMLTEFNLRADPETVVSRQKYYLQREAAIRGEHARAVAGLTDKLVAALDRLQTDLTRQNQIEPALSVREYKDKAKARPEVKGAYELADVLKRAEETEKAELQKAVQMAQAATPPAPVAPAPAVEEDKPERGDRAKDHARIKERFEQFIEYLSTDQFAKAEEIVDPEQARKAGSFILQAYFHAFKPYLKFAESLGGRIEAGKVKTDPEGQTAQNFPLIRFKDNRETGKPSDWVKRNGEWYIVFKDKEKEKEKGNEKERDRERDRDRDRDRKR
jgi:hypothetical protein